MRPPPKVFGSAGRREARRRARSDAMSCATTRMCRNRKAGSRWVAHSSTVAPARYAPSAKSASVARRSTDSACGDRKQRRRLGIQAAIDVDERAVPLGLPGVPPARASNARARAGRPARPEQRVGGDVVGAVAAVEAGASTGSHRSPLGKLDQQCEVTAQQSRVCVPDQPRMCHR